MRFLPIWSESPLIAPFKVWNLLSINTADCYRQCIFMLGGPTLGRGYSPHSSTTLDRECYLLLVKTHAGITLTKRTEFGYNYQLCYRHWCIFTKSGLLAQVQTIHLQKQLSFSQCHIENTCCKVCNTKLLSNFMRTVNISTTRTDDPTT